MPAPARSARWCSSSTARWSPRVGADAHPRRSAPTAPSSTPRGCGTPSSRCCAGWWRSCRTPRRSGASRSPASARPACSWMPVATPLAPIIAWYDTRTTGELEWLLADGRLRAAAPHHRPVRRPDLQPAQAALVPAPAARAVRRGAEAWLNVGDYLAWRLCGERATDVSLASRTLLLDLEQRQLVRRAPGGGRAAGLRSCRRCGRTAAAIGTIRPEIAAATGLPPDCVIGVGGHDHVCGMIAAGADRAGRAARQPGHRRGA